MTLEPTFVGESRRLVVDELLIQFDKVRDSGEPLWISLEAPSGWGKTRIVREFYNRLAAERQSPPPYWPASILGAAEGADPSDVTSRRKRVYPEIFTRPSGSLPDWMWWGIACSERNGVPSRALVHDLGQLEAHEAYLEAAWRAQVTFRRRHGTSLSQLREALSDELRGEGISKAAEAIVGSAVPGIGLMVTLARWTTNRAVDRNERRDLIASEATIGTMPGRADLADDVVETITRLAVPNLPVIIFVEDFHPADDLLLDVLGRSLRSRSTVLVLTTGWPGPDVDPETPAVRLAAATPAGRALRVQHDASAPSPFPAASLSELGPEDLETIVRHYFPAAVSNTVAGLTERYHNPLALELVCLQPSYQNGDVAGHLDLTHEEIAALPIDVEDLYAMIWRQLPEPVQRGLALAALAVPIAIDAERGGADERWHPRPLAEVAGAMSFEWAKLDDALLDAPIDYAWARTVGDVLRQFNEPGQRRVASRQAERFFGRQRLMIYTHLATQMLADSNRDLTNAVAEHRAHTILALTAVGAITDPRAITAAAVTLVSGLYPHPREHHRLIELVAWVRSAVGSGYDADDLATMNLRLYEARALTETGRVADASAAFEALAADLARVLGPDDPTTLSTRHNLSFVLDAAGRSADAMRVLEALLQDSARVLGPEHPSVLETRHNLEYLRGEMATPAEAITANEGLLATEVRVLGADHPETLRTRHNIAAWLGDAGRATEAIAAFKAVLGDRTRVLGPDHADTLKTRYSLAHWLGEGGRPEQAIAAMEAVLGDRIRVLGHDHPDTLKTRSSLAGWLGRAGPPAAAIAAFEVVLGDLIRVLGQDHPDTLAARYNLAFWLGEADRLEEAIAAFEPLVRDHARILGPDHPHTFKTRSNLAHWLGMAGRPAEAAAAYETLLADRTRVLGPDHPDTLKTGSSLEYWRQQAIR